jgi:tetratricopeptide (TPR) repeat protein
VFLLFFTATSGFAVQYLAWLTPWVAELGALPVALFMVTGSVFLLVVYNYWNLGMPWYMAIAYPWSSHQYFQVLCWISVLLLTFAAWRRIRSGRALTFPSLRIPLPLRLAAAAAAIALLLVYPAIVHMRRDWLGREPVYDVDEVLFTQANERHNLAAALLERGRIKEAYEVEDHAKEMDVQAQHVADSLTRLQPARLVLRTPEDYVDTSEHDYDNGDFGQCVIDARESLKLRPGMPAAWYNISICSGQLGDWDAAVAAATAAMRIEPESDVVRQNLDWTIAQRSLAVSYKR